VPALIISTAAGIMVTAATSTDKIGTVLSRQLGSQPRVMWIASGVLGAFALVPGIPMFPFLTMAVGAAAVARLADRAERDREALALIMSPAASGSVTDTPAIADSMQDLLQIDPIELEVGYALIPLIDESQGGDLLERISLLRKQAALELGILVPPIRIRDDIRLPANEYVIKLRGAEVAHAEVLPRFLMALNTGGVVAEIDGMETIDPSFGMPAKWVAVARRSEAEALGYVVVEPTTVVATHLLETLKGSAAELLGRQEVQEMVERLKRSHPALVEEILPGKVSLSVLHRVLQRLLRERIPIRDLVTILEAIGDGAETTKDPEALTEVVRKSLTNVIARLFADQTGTVRGITIGARLEGALLGLFSPRSAQPNVPILSPELLAAMLRDLNTLATTFAVDGRPLPLITPPSLRVGVRRLIEPVLPSLPVVSLAELPAQVTLSSVTTWEMPHD
jgi:flagellar biosynthesis protein FlhA